MIAKTNDTDTIAQELENVRAQFPADVQFVTARTGPVEITHPDNLLSNGAYDADQLTNGANAKFAAAAQKVLLDWRTKCDRARAELRQEIYFGRRTELATAAFADVSRLFIDTKDAIERARKAHAELPPVPTGTPSQYASDSYKVEIIQIQKEARDELRQLKPVERLTAIFADASKGGKTYLGAIASWPVADAFINDEDLEQARTLYRIATDQKTMILREFLAIADSDARGNYRKAGDVLGVLFDESGQPMFNANHHLQFRS
ncbi:MAG: hypothetical protein QM770_24665 [Tepidisphaeraceae bacterium]